MVEVQILTVPFNPGTGLFEDEGVKRYLAHRRLLKATPHFFMQEGKAWWTVFLETSPLGAPQARGPQTSLIPQDLDDRRRREQKDVRAQLANLSEQERSGYERLRHWRRDTASEEGLPVYVLLTNRQMLAIVEQAPQTLESLRQIKGIGEKRIKKHGHKILEVLHGATLSPGGSKPAQALRSVDGDEQVADAADPPLAQTPETHADGQGGEPDAGDP